VSDGVDSCTATVAAAGCTIHLTTVGARTLTATYAGDSNFNSSTSATAAHTINRADTTSTISSDDPDPSVVGEDVVVQYRVTANAPGGGTPTGNVTVTDGTQSCMGTVAAGQCTITFATAGAKSLTATYASDLNYNSSPASASVSHHVNQADTTTTITGDDPDPSVASQSVTVNFAVAPVGGGGATPTGSVTVSDGVDSCTGAVAAGQCSIVLTSAGSRTLTAGYGGDSNFNPSSSPGEAHTVNPPNSGAEQQIINPPSGSGGEPIVNPPGGSGGEPIVNPLAPPLAHVFGASQTHPKFRVSPKRQLVQTSRRPSPIGTIFKYKLDIAATVRFDFTQPASGRTVNGKCGSLNRRNKRKPKCTLQRGSLPFAGHAGLNTVRFNGWLARTKKLTPGKYTLVITAITPGVGATTQTLRFSIVR
jgi:hypothetical protein